MALDLVLSNLLTPPVLFYFLGALAVLARSDLELPAPLPKLFSLYLLLSIGFRGGVELRHGGIAVAAWTLGAAIVAATLIPAYTFFVLRKFLDVPNAAALAATYGSVSAVTFIAATSFLGELNIPSSGHMVAALALMESPAIVVGVLLARRHGKAEPTSAGELIREAFFNGSVFLLVGSLVVGLLSGKRGEAALHPFVSDAFKGVLCLFLLDMGIVSARRLRGLRTARGRLFAFALAAPLVNATLGIGTAVLLGLGRGDALLFTVLCAGASYIAVPAAMRLAVPDADPGIYLPLALGVTFPFNVAIGIPLYMTVIERTVR